METTAAGFTADILDELCKILCEDEVVGCDHVGRGAVRWAGPQ